MNLYLTNTLTHKKEAFKSREPQRVKLFTCGPSVYRRPHVGNYATFLFEDLLHRYLEYKGYRVQRIINFTDIEDKAVAEANQKKVSLTELTQPVADLFRKEAGLLEIKLPREIPRSTTHVDEAVKLIQKLIQKGYAYWHEKDVFFDPLKFKGFGKLFNLDMRRWPKKRRRFRKDTYPGQRWNLGDFILWHGYRPNRDGSIYWDTPLGMGRPAWNIQDPAIIRKHLGWHIDIACGGVDNLYRHHDYTIAVMESLSQGLLAPYWLHGEHVLVGGQKMSKSKGNILYLKDITERGYTTQDIRFYLIDGHYRKKINFTFHRLQKSVAQLNHIKNGIQELCNTPSPEGQRPATPGDPAGDLIRDFENHMNNDLDVRGAFDDLQTRLNRLKDFHRHQGLHKQDQKAIHQALTRMDQVFRVLF